MCEGVEPDEETRASEREREAAPFGTSHRHRPLVFLLSTSPTPPRPPTMLGRRGIFKKEKKYHKLVDVLFPAELDAPIVAYAPIVTIRERATCCCQPSSTLRSYIYHLSVPQTPLGKSDPLCEYHTQQASKDWQIH
jgi:hypothetical protein